MDSISVDVSATGQPFTSTWRYCVGTGRLGLALQQEYLDHLTMVQKEIGFHYIRGHGLFHDDVGIYREDTVDGVKVPFYNFTYIDRIFDSFLERGIRPFLELGFMPKLLASGENAVFYWKGNTTPPADYSKWAALVKATLSHFIARYGLEEVLKWPVEVWNEPNLPGFWKDADKQEYFKLYRVTAEAVKAVHPDLKVGGPAVCGGADHWITDFLAYCKTEKIPMDFVSRHAYTSMQPDVTPHFFYQELHDNTYMLDELRDVRKMIDETDYKGWPFHITEYNTSWHPLNPVHDTVLNAAYLCRILSESAQYVDSFSYWTFSDVFEEWDVPRSQFHGGFGLVALGGIPKPTFHIFRFFRKVEGEVLYRDHQTLITKRADGSIAVLAWNKVMDKGEVSAQAREISLPNGFEDTFVKKSSISETNGNPWKTWIQMGRPRFPSKEQVACLKEIAQPLVTTDRLVFENEVPCLRFALSKNEVALFEMTAVQDESNTYLGLDDSKVTSY